MNAWKKFVVLAMSVGAVTGLAALTSSSSMPPVVHILPAAVPLEPSTNTTAAPVNPPKLKIDYKSPAADAKGVSNDKSPTVTVTITNALDGKLTPKIGDRIAGKVADVKGGDTQKEVELNLAGWENLGPQTVYVQWSSSGSELAESNSLQFEYDTQGPLLDNVKLIGTPGAPPKLVVRFQQPDLKPGSFTGNFNVKMVDATKAEEITAIRPVDGATVELFLGLLRTGNYELTVVGKNATPLRDNAGNPAGGGEGKDQIWPFSSYPEREKGPHVEFPEYVPHPKPTEGFNPGDFVATRVARLYYYRDAHRVAEIINRNVKSYNRAAVDLARREAEASRDRADTATDLRRQREREAIEKAQETRRVERELSELPAKLADAANREAQLAELHKKEKSARVAREEKVKTLATQLKESNDTVTERTKTRQSKQTAEEQLKKKLDDAGPMPPEDLKRQYAEAQKETASAATAEEESKKARDTKSDELTQRQGELADAAEDEKRAEREYELAKTKRENLLNRQKELTEALPRLRQAENQTREIMDQSQAKEDRSREDQFRKEVAAAHEDPDTYVPGKPESVDPVTQVSISVIGEGLIQLRGPIRGINKIRTMINQIDSPVGQVKVGIFTVQVNGEHGDRMEKVAQRIEGHVDLSRFLTSQSLMMLRRAVQETAARVIEHVDATCGNGHCQADRDRKYMYTFFGRDFMDELFEMNSELLMSGNKVLSLHAMDTVSLSKATFLVALAKNDIRQEILRRFMEIVDQEMPEAEFDFRKTSGLLPCRLNSQREIQKNVWEKYRFRSIRGFFYAEVNSPDTMTPMQREFIRLAQIFKSQMVAEMELKQRVIERALIEDRANEDDYEANLIEPVHKRALESVKEAYDAMLKAEPAFQAAFKQLQAAVSYHQRQSNEAIAAKDGIKLLQTQTLADDIETAFMEKVAPELSKDSNEGKAFDLPLAQKARFRGIGGKPETYKIVGIDRGLLTKAVDAKTSIAKFGESSAATSDAAKSLALNTQPLNKAVANLNELEEALRAPGFAERGEINVEDLTDWADAIRTTAAAVQQENLVKKLESIGTTERAKKSHFEDLRSKFVAYRRLAQNPDSNWDRVEEAFYIFMEVVKRPESGNQGPLIEELANSAHEKALAAHPGVSIHRAQAVARTSRQRLDHKKLLSHLIDEQEDKYIELVEGTRAHIATIDNYLKRLAIAIEDDCKVQFYDPAFTGIRKASYEYDVQLGQVERTTILTNNRAFAKVSPQATMEFDLPKRDIMIVEGMKGAKAMMEDYGALLQDPTFLTATQMLSGSPVAGKTGAASAAGGATPPAVKDVLPGLPSQSDEKILNQSSGQDRQMGAALSALVPDPAIYKFETGTGFEIRPVIQPDGDSIVYDFNYMYTTNVREPVRADEKHLGRVKRHFIDTQVQTSSFELREISRYQVALKASRTGRGVPLFEDIPGLGVLFRPQASAESALQQNIILGQSTVYPTLFDLMGLRWAPHLVDAEGQALRETEHVVRGRRQTVSDFVFEEASDRVDGFLGIKHKAEYEQLYRPDLYHQQSRPSRFHPSGYEYRDQPITDPTGRDFRRHDPRPTEFQREPCYDEYGRPICEPDGGYEDAIMPHDGPEIPRMPVREEPKPSTNGATGRGVRRPGSTGSRRAVPDDAAVKRAGYDVSNRGREPGVLILSEPQQKQATTQSSPAPEPSMLKKVLKKLPFGRGSEK